MLLVGGDYAAIEGRGTAWIAGEHWKLDAFRAADAGTGPGIYELAYAKAFNVPVESIKNPSDERQQGKVMELAFGYQGGLGAWKTMAKTYGVKIPDEKAEQNKVLWRNAHPATVDAWKALQKAAIQACRAPGAVIDCRDMPLDETMRRATGMQPVKFRVVGSFLWCLLPSGRALCYPYPKLLPGKYGDQVTYMTVPDPNKLEKIIADPANTSGWARVGTYGGKLMENVVQAVCRDILSGAMLRLEAAGFALVFHVHDDVQSEEEIDRSEEMSRIMCAGETWSTGFPIYAKCHAARRYGK